MYLHCYLVGVFLREESVLDEQDDGVVCDGCHKEQQHYAEHKSRLLQGRGDA